MVSKKSSSTRPKATTTAQHAGTKSTTARRAIDDLDDGDWKSFRPGAVCGGKLKAEDVVSRSKGATEACLKALKKSTVYKSWERGEDLSTPAGGSLLALLKKTLVVALVVVVAVSTSIYREKSMGIGRNDMRVPVPAMEPLPLAGTDAVVHTDDALEEPEVAAPLADPLIDKVSMKDHDAPKMPAVEHAPVAVPPEGVRLELQQQLEDLQFEVKLQTTRATQAKEKEDSLFKALEASTRRLHELSRDLQTSQNQVDLLENKVKLSVRHSEVLKSVDRTLLGMETLLVLSSIVGFVRSHKIRSSLLRARRSFMMAYRRQQRVLALADEVYAEAMKYNAEVEAADVGPRGASATEVERVLNPWDPLLDDLESLIKTNLSDRLNRGDTPVQVLQALAAHFAELKCGNIEMEEKVEKTRAALESSITKVRTLENEISEAKKSAEHDAEALKAESAKTRHLSSSLASAEAKACGLEDQVRAAAEERASLSNELIRAKEEIEKVKSYAASLEKAGFAATARGGGTLDLSVEDHLKDFSVVMDTAVGRRDQEGGTYETNMDSIEYTRNSGDDERTEKENVGQRLQMIKKLIQEADSSPFQLLSPSTEVYEGTDAGVALRNLPVIGSMNIESSDSEDGDLGERQDGSVQRMLDSSTELSNEVSDYLLDLHGIASAEILENLSSRRDAVDNQRKRVEALAHTSQKEARACRALKVKRKEVDFLSEKEEIAHGEEELKAFDRRFFALKKEKDAMLELESLEATLRSALEHARQKVRATR